MYNIEIMKKSIVNNSVMLANIDEYVNNKRGYRV